MIPLSSFQQNYYFRNKKRSVVRNLVEIKLCSIASVFRVYTDKMYPGLFDPLNSMGLAGKLYDG